MSQGFRPGFALKGGLLVLGGCATIGFVAVAFAADPVPTTLEDFKMSGTQPSTIIHPISDVTECGGCHGFYDEAHEPWANWASSMMGQAMRDPVFLAAMSIANQDADFAGDLCLRCHTPGGWLEGRSTPTDGSALLPVDFQGVSCSFCHRMVDPVYQAGVSPDADVDVLNALTEIAPGIAAIPQSPNGGNYVVDTFDRRRGPLDFDVDYPGGFFFHEWEHSPFHKASQMCATCHDVSNPVFDRQPDDTYVLNTMNEPHQTQGPYDQFPVERTYSEWLMSSFADGPIEMGGRFGGEITAVSSCQDCHMPDANAEACRVGGTPTRPDMPVHQFNGGNNWVIQAVRNLYPDEETGLTDTNVAGSIARAENMLVQASDMELSMVGGDLNVRVINQTGHKLPSGYPEGRRIWINVRFLDDADALIAERGAYNSVDAILTSADTKVYEANLGVDAAVAAAINDPAMEGPSFHFVLSNVRIKDNRIPPRGFTNAEFTTIQSEPVAYTYADGDYWDDTLYTVPKGATKAEVRVYYQSLSKEYMEFLRDESQNGTGQTAYDQWVLLGKSPIVEMDTGMIALSAPCPADFTGEGSLDIFDILAFLDAFNAGDSSADFTGDGNFDIFDILDFLDAFNAGCP